MSLSLIIRVRS